MMALILLAQASQPWLVPSESYEPIPQPPAVIEAPKPNTSSPFMVDGQGRLTFQPFNESRDWPAYVEPITPEPYSDGYGGGYRN